MSYWITDRRPTRADADKYGYVWITGVNDSVYLAAWTEVGGRPWQHSHRPEPCVKPKRYKVEEYYHSRGIWVVKDCQTGNARFHPVPTRDAAERIAAIYEEVSP